LIGRGFPVVPVGCAVVVAGTLVVAVPNAPVPVVVGLAVAGLGTAAFYPVTLARLVQVPGMSVARGPAFGALASGTAILVAPVVLAALGAALDLRAAYLLAVLPLAVALATTTRKELAS
jgi:MFS family permease